MAVQAPSCILCRKLRQHPYHGLCIKGHYICPECEARIIVLTRDDPDYDYYKWGLKKIWHWPGA